MRGFEGVDVGDRIHVRLIAVDVERGFIDFEAVGSSRRCFFMAMLTGMVCEAVCNRIARSDTRYNKQRTTEANGPPLGAARLLYKAYPLR